MKEREKPIFRRDIEVLLDKKDKKSFYEPINIKKF